MGERANIVFTSGHTLAVGRKIEKIIEGNLCLYMHWGGDTAAPTLRRALQKAKPRWGDDSYATRIVVSQFIGDEWDSETGFGLSVGALPDNNYNILIVDWLTRQVISMTEQGERVGCVDFDTFLKMDDDEATWFHEPHTEDA